MTGSCDQFEPSLKTTVRGIREDAGDEAVIFD